MAKYKGVFLYAPGNHDYDGGAERHLSSARLCELFQQPSLQYADGNLHLTGHNCWSYYDRPEKRLRIITLSRLYPGRAASAGTETPVREKQSRAAVRKMIVFFILSAPFLLVRACADILFVEILLLCWNAMGRILIVIMRRNKIPT